MLEVEHTVAGLENYQGEEIGIIVIGQESAPGEEEGGSELKYVTHRKAYQAQGPEFTLYALRFKIFSCLSSVDLVGLLNLGYQCMWFAARRSLDSALTLPLNVLQYLNSAVINSSSLV